MSYVWVAINIFFAFWCWRASEQYFKMKEGFSGWYCLVASAANAAGAAAILFLTWLLDLTLNGGNDWIAFSV